MIEEIKEGKTKDVKFDTEDFDHLAEYVYETYLGRKKKRADKERMWQEVDRQIAMRPEDKKRPAHENWMPRMELPLQAQALETLCADVRSMLFPENEPWYGVYGENSQKLVKAYADLESLFGDKMGLVQSYNEAPSFDQADLDMITQSFINNYHDATDFQAMNDLIVAESLKYGVGLGRGKMVVSNKFSRTERGVEKDAIKLPHLVPVSIKNTYLDDSKHALMHEGYNIGETVIQHRYLKYEDLIISAKKGNKDPKDENGGWMPNHVERVEPDKKGCVEVLEMEGDIVLPKKGSGSFYIPNAIVTAVVGKNKKDEKKCCVVRFRFRQTSLSTYIQYPYHIEDCDSPYASSPLIKGYPIQKSACDALNRTIMAGALSTQPVIKYDRDDAKFAADGGPEVFPGAKIASLGDVEVLRIGDPGAMLAAYSLFVNQYQEMTGITAARLGAQTVSHTTAYAKDVEVNRGQARTVDFVKSIASGPLTKWLYLSYDMARKEMEGKEQKIFVNDFKCFVNIEQNHLPERVKFEVYGSAQPSNEASKMQAKMQSLQMAMSIDQLKVSMGLGSPLNYNEIQKELLRQGGFKDVERFNIDTGAGVPQDAAGAGGIPDAAQGAGAEPSPGAAIQALAIQGIPR